MFTVSLMKGYKPKYVIAKDLDEATKIARSFWYYDPVVIDNTTHRPVAVDLDIKGFAESEC